MNETFVLCCSAVTVFGLIALYVVARLVEFTFEDMRRKMRRKN